MTARIQVEIQFSDHLSLANAVEAYLTGRSSECTSKQLQQPASTHHQQQQQSSCFQTHQQQQLSTQQMLQSLPEPPASSFSSADYFAELGSLSPARSSQLFGSLDFLHDMGLSPGDSCLTNFKSFMSINAKFSSMDWCHCIYAYMVRCSKKIARSVIIGLQLNGACPHHYRSGCLGSSLLQGQGGIFRWVHSESAQTGLKDCQSGPACLLPTSSLAKMPLAM